MTISSIRDQFISSGRLSASARDELRQYLQGNDPYSAITLVGDAGESRLIPDVALCLDSPDPMVRWNAANVIFTRVQDVSYAEDCLRISKTDEDLLVRAAALCGLGELLAEIENVELRKSCSLTLLSVLENPTEQLGLRSAAYEGLLAALEIPVSERPAASRYMDPDRDVKPPLVKQFKEKYL